MIAAEDNDGVVIEFASLQRVEELANAVIDIADSAVVRSTSLLDLLIIELNVPEVTDLEKTLAVGVLLFLGDLDLWELNVHALIHVPIFLLDGIWVVGVRQRNLENVGLASSHLCRAG
jgi:hypothetical protein